MYQLVGEPRLALAWEIDNAATAITSHHMPFVKHRGDFMADSVPEIARLIHRHDPHQQCWILVLSAPPCPDFSSINSSAEGFSGSEGSKFDSFLQFSSQLEEELHEWTFIHLCENVIMQTKAEIQHVSHGLQAEPVVIDAADLGIISRPRLWWTRHPWSSSDRHPISGEALRWGSHHKINKLYMDMPLSEADHFDFDGFELPGVIVRHEKRLPCLTTPAPTAEGRPPPKKLKGKMDPECRSRWLNDGRRFAPWHYDKNSMLQKEGEMIIPWADHKDQLHGFVKGYTGVTGASEHDRHRLLGNSWHLQVARFVLMILLQHCGTSEAFPMSTPRETALQFVCNLARAEDPALGTHPPFQDYATHRTADDLWDHWHLSADCRHPVLTPPVPERGALQALEKCMRGISDIDRMRKEIVAEVLDLVELWHDDTSTWLASRPSHIQAVYNQTSGSTPTQVPLFLYLLEQTGFPSMDDVVDDMTNGFALTSRQHHGPGWPVRTDDRYSNPITEEQFSTLNEAYIQAKLKKGHVDPHWQAMLSEILTECELGRMDGPYAAPSHWPVKTISVEGRDLLPLPDHPIRASVCFAVEQHDKIRRCEDFKRSWHNSLMIAYDSPIHHGVDHYVQLCRWEAAQGQQPHLWTHDLAAAYRQLPVREIDKAWTILQTPSGPLLWKHHALSFGASGSVWGFNRFADLMQYLSRKLLWTPTHHYVDDFASAEHGPLASSSFESFAGLFNGLGLRVKEKKAQPPSTVQKLLGVFFDIGHDYIRLKPCPHRMERLLQTMRRILDTNVLKIDDAQKLCGKLNFLQTTSFGQVGRALLLPLYSRAHSRDTDNQQSLNGPIVASLTTLLHLLPGLPSKTLPLTTDHPCTSIYTDAFFQLGDQPTKPSEDTVPRSWRPSTTKWTSNGWGFVIRSHSHVLASHGVIPPSVLQPFSRRRAFIYILELMAPVIALVSLHKTVDPFVILWIDNRAGLSALQKGWGRDPPVNNMLTFFWCFMARIGVHLHCEWVASAHNLADGISRHDLREVRMGGWSLLQLHLKPLHKILQRCAVDAEYSATSAVDDALSWSSSLRLSDLVLDGESVLEMGDI